MLYQKVLFPIFAALSRGDAEAAHVLAIRAIKTLQHVPFVLRLIAYWCEANKNPRPVTVCGMEFPNRVGLAAGLDKQGELLEFFQALGFGFVEIGTVTPFPQIGNPRPRLFRISNTSSLLNRYGFNSDGVQAVAKRLEKVRDRIHIPIGGSVGKQKETPLGEAAGDYVEVLTELSPYVDYHVGNVSSPNTPGLRELQGYDYLVNLVREMVDTERAFALIDGGTAKPVFAKFSPDMTDKELFMAIQAAEAGGASGFIFGNTTLQRPPRFCPTGPMIDKEGYVSGGFSGPHQFPRTLDMITLAAKYSKLPSIACGGLRSPSDMLQVFDRGAALIQVYTSFIYQGPSLIRVLKEIEPRKIYA